MHRVFRIGVYIFAIIGFVLVVVYVASRLGLTNTPGMIDNQHDYFKNQVKNGGNRPVAAWENSEEWSVLKQAIVKDAQSIQTASKQTGIPSRLIVAPLVVEQLRLFHDNREIFKDIFAPLKILGNQSQFSWGVMGIKQDTARQIEKNLTDFSSPYYLGAEFSHILDYATSTDPDSERFDRLIKEKDRYYSYVYSALLIKELEAQWQKAGFQISERPDVIATLFNIGFEHSHPNANPEVGGAVITIATTTYSFGGLAADFYASEQLVGEFPR